MAKEQKLTLEDGKEALAGHVAERGCLLNEKYGPIIDESTIDSILKDSEFVRFPTQLLYDTNKVEEGLFAVSEMLGEKASDGYVIILHEGLKSRPYDIPAAVLYHLVAVNYGDFSTSEEAEIFGSCALNMPKEAYYNQLCELADNL